MRSERSRCPKSTWPRSNSASRRRRTAGDSTSRTAMTGPMVCQPREPVRGSRRLPLRPQHWIGPDPQRRPMLSGYLFNSSTAPTNGCIRLVWPIGDSLPEGTRRRFPRGGAEFNRALLVHGDLAAARCGPSWEPRRIGSRSSRVMSSIKAPRPRDSPAVPMPRDRFAGSGAWLR